MKTGLNFFSTLVLVFLFQISSFSQANIVITEVVDASAFAASFVEIHNAGDAAQDITGWKLYENGAAVATVGTVTLQPCEYLVFIRGTLVDLEGLYGTYPAASYYVASTGLICNGTDYFELKDAALTVIDNAGSTTSKTTSNTAYERVDANSAGTTFGTDWSAMANRDLATPGKDNLLALTNDICATPACTAPTTQATNITFSSVTGTSMTVNWTRGNGDAGVIVVAKLNTSTLTDPTSGTTYTANAVFGSGTQIGTGNYVVYQGTGTSVNVTGLATASTYDFAIYEYNATGICFELTELAGSQATTCTSPTTQASTATFSAVTSSSMTIGWTRGNGDGVLVVVKAGSAVDTDPTGGTTYTASTVFGSGTQIGTGNYVVYQGTGTSVSITGLTSATTYYIAVYEYTGAGGTCYNLTELTGSQATTTAPCISEGFEGGTTDPTGWSNNSSYYNSTAPYTGTNMAGMNAAGDWIMTTQELNPNTLTFWVEASGTTSNFVLSIETSPDNVVWTPQTTYAANGSNTGTITNTYSQKTVVLGLTGSYYIRFKLTSRSAGSCYLDDVELNCSSGPEINVKETATSYASGSTYDFGSAAVSSNTDIVFTIENTGLADLTITTPLSASGDYSIIAQPSSPVAASGTTTFTVRFTPSVAGTRTGSVTITNNDSDEGSYVINFTGVGLAGSNASDIISNTTFVYPANINYLLYPSTANITTANSIEVYQFDIRDGGAASDADALTTTLTDISFSITNSSVIDRVALYDGTTELAEVAGAASISFTGLTTAAADNGSKTLSLRVTYQSSVVDNTQYSFTVTSASADITGSIFAAADAGGAVSSTTGDDNRLEVTATTVAWGTQPADQITNANLTSVTVNAVDANGNTDLDENTCTVALTTTGTGMTSGSPYTFVSGVATMSDIQFSTANTAITLTATAQSCLGNGATTSGTFNITVFTYLSGDWRTTTTGAGLGFNGYGWESFNGTVWSAEATAPQNIGSSPSRIIIRHSNCDGADNTGTNGSRTFEYNDIIIISGGELILNDNKTGSITATWNPFIATGKKLEVQSGGILRINGDIDMGSSTRSLNVLDGGKIYLNQPTVINTHMMWAGTEDFQDNSEIIVQDWDWAAGSATVRSFLNPTYQIPTNSSGNGYKIGHLTYDCTPTTQDQTILPAVTTPLSFCNNLTITNNSTTYSISLTANKISFPVATVGGNVTVNEGTFIFGINYTDGAVQRLTVLGDVDINYADATNPTVAYLHAFGGAASTLAYMEFKVQGSVTVATGASLITGPDADSKLHSKLIFDGAVAQTVNGGGTIDLTNVEINKSANEVTLTRNLTASDSLLFTSGNFVLGANTLQLGTTAIGIQTGGSSTSYAVTDGAGSYKRMQLATATNYDFPIGPSTTSYNPATINYAGTVDDFSARVEVGLNPTTGSDAAFVNRTWNIAEGVAGGTTAILTLQWQAAHENGSFVRNSSNIHHYVSNWTEETFSTRAGADPYTCTDNAITSFSPFAVGTIGSLPIELLYFDAEPSGDIIELSWATLSEINNDYFEVERSVDAVNFVPICKQTGAGNSVDRNTYTDYDFAPFTGLNYYRLKQVDFDGAYSYSSIVVASVKGKNEPVISQNEHIITMINNYPDAIISIYDLRGKLLKKVTNANEISIASLSNGIYIVRTESGDLQKQWKININH